MPKTNPSDESSAHPTRSCPNVGRWERTLSVAAGAAALLGGLRRRGITGLLAGGVGIALLRRGISGHCNVYERLGIDTRRETREEAGVPEDQGIKVVETITINRPRDEVYGFWRDLRNLPRFMDHLSTVEIRTEEESRWVASGPGGRTLEWDARIINDQPGELIAWESLPGADLQSAGSVRFESAPGDRGTQLTLTLLYRPPLGRLGALGAKLLNRSPEHQLREDLRRLRQLLEAGEMATADISS